MKKIIVLLILFFGFGISAYADMNQTASPQAPTAVDGAAPAAQDKSTNDKSSKSAVDKKTDDVTSGDDSDTSKDPDPEADVGTSAK